MARRDHRVEAMYAAWVVGEITVREYAEGLRFHYVGRLLALRRAQRQVLGLVHMAERLREAV